MKIMFVCTGNTCRSAMAKGMLEMKLKELGKNKINVTIGSALDLFGGKLEFEKIVKI